MAPLERSIGTETKEAFVYILAHSTLPRFKIGKANDILSRAQAFGLGSIDFSRSFGLRMRTEQDAYRVEDILHKTLQHWRLRSEDVRESGGATDGETEWFDTACRERLEKLLKDISDLLMCVRVPSGDLQSQYQHRVDERERLFLEKMERAAERDFEKTNRRCDRLKRRFNAILSKTRGLADDQERREHAGLQILLSGKLSSVEQEYLMDLIDRKAP